MKTSTPARCESLFSYFLKVLPIRIKPVTAHLKMETPLKYELILILSEDRKTGKKIQPLHIDIETINNMPNNLMTPKHCGMRIYKTQ